MTDYKELPQFKGGLQFGDSAQIAFVQEQRRDGEEQEYMEEQGMKKYRVHVYIDGSYTQDVWASCEDDAVDKVKDEFAMEYADIDLQYDGEEL